MLGGAIAQPSEVINSNRLCAGPEGLMRQEALYLKALPSAATFRLDGTRIELRRADAAPAVTFNRK